MTVLLLSLLACTLEHEDDDVLPPPADDTPVLADGVQPMATKPVAASEWSRDRRVVSATTPAGELVRTDCYGGRGERQRLRSGSSRPASGGGMARPRPSRPSPAPQPSPEAVTAGPPAAAPMRVPAEAMDRAAAPEAESARASRPDPSVSSKPMMQEAKKERKDKKDKALEGYGSLADAEDADGRADTKGWGEALPKRPTMDWGATVYLSNDDSMSLASAQRTLWAVDQGKSFSPSEVRPHELLNYFSFDTVPVPDGQTFSVLGSAEQNGETLSVALAVQGAMPARQPLDLTLVIDRSGSMRAEGRMEYVRKGLTQMTDQLQDGDRIDLVLFDSGVCSPLQNFVVGRDSTSVLVEEINRIQPRGSTDLDGGLREGYRIQSARDAADVHKRNRRILLLTDAFLNTGNVDQDLVSEIGKRFDEDHIRVTGVGVGRDFNDKMLDLITEKGKGAYVYLGSEAVVDRVFGSGFDSLVQTIAHDVRFSIELPDSLAMERFYGEESSTNAEDVQPINYYAGTSQVFLQDLKIRKGHFDPSDTITFKAAYRDAVTGEPAEQMFSTSVATLLAGDSHNLDKAQALMKWTDLLAERAMGDRRCSSLAPYRRAAAQVQGDAEIAYVSSLTGKLCGVDMSQTVAATGVRFKVKLDSDLPIPEVQLQCAGESWTETLSGSDTVARFDDVYPGSCQLVLQGTVPMRASVKVPETGGDVRCMVRGGRVNCG